MEWGWNPDTLIAIATTLAMFAAMTAGYFARRSYHQMLKQVREAVRQTDAANNQALEAAKQTVEARAQTTATKQQVEWAAEDRKRAQAELVAAWTEATLSDDQETLHVVLQNLSAAPVANVRIATRMGTAKDPEYFYAAREDFLRPTGKECHRIVPSKASSEHWPEWKRKRTRNLYPGVDIIFRDARGIDWIRNADGQLEKYADGERIPGHWKRSTGNQIFAHED